MTTPITQIARPEAGQYTGQRKLFLVPIFLFPPDIPDDASQLLERYWSEVRDHIQNLERSLGSVKHVFHETIYADGEEGMRMVEAMNPLGRSFIQAMCSAGASLEATEDRAVVEEPQRLAAVPVHRLDEREGDEPRNGGHSGRRPGSDSSI